MQGRPCGAIRALRRTRAWRAAALGDLHGVHLPGLGDAVDVRHHDVCVCVFGFFFFGFICVFLGFFFCVCVCVFVFVFVFVCLRGAVEHSMSGGPIRVRPPTCSPALTRTPCGHSVRVGESTEPRKPPPPPFIYFTRVCTGHGGLEGGGRGGGVLVHRGADDDVEVDVVVRHLGRRRQLRQGEA